MFMDTRLFTFTANAFGCGSAALRTSAVQNNFDCCRDNQRNEDIRCEEFIF